MRLIRLYWPTMPWLVLYHILAVFVCHFFTINSAEKFICLLILSSIISTCIATFGATYFFNYKETITDTKYDINDPYVQQVSLNAKVDVNIVSCMTVGPPTVGKTTLREQLSDQSNNQSTRQQHARPLSTRVMDRIKILRSTVNDNTWGDITSDEEFIAYIKSTDNQAYYKYSYWSIYLLHVAISVFPPAIAAKILALITDYLSISISKYHFTLTHIIVTVLCITCYKFIFANGRAKNKSIELAKQALQNKEIKQVPPLNEYTLIIHFRDSGGQPEFHEVVPALVPHSTLYLLMFNLNEDLNKQCEVTYKANEDDITDPYQSSFTVKESLLQLLASIQSFNHSLQGITSNAFIIGTHKDRLVDEETRINQIQQELEKEIKGTDWYTSDTILTTLDGHLMLPIDTYSQDDVEEVKEMINQSIATKRYTVQTTILMLYFTIEKLNKSVMSFREFISIAKECNINDITKAVTFLQHKMGSIQYFGTIPELKDIVITDPQILFDLVNELIVCTFNFKNLRTVGSRHQTERFRSSGRFMKKSLKKCEVVKNGLLTEDQVISILQHLNIIAPVGINDKGEEEYFLPCVLVHAPVSTQPTSINTTGYSPLLITFKCGYTPRGVFSCLISSILCSSEGLWVLASEEIYRDQVKFHLTNRGDIVLIKNCLKYLEVSVTVCHGSIVSDVPFSDIQTFLSKHLKAVLHQLNYSPSKAGHSFGFYCSLEQHSGHSLHIAQCMSNAKNRHIKCTIDSSLEPSCLTPEQAVWFKDDFEASSRNTFNISNLATILRFLTEGYYYANTWHELGLELGIRDPTLKRIKSDVRGDTQACLRETLSAWLRQEDDVKEKGAPSWSTLAKALDAIGQHSIAEMAYKNI